MGCSEMVAPQPKPGSCASRGDPTQVGQVLLGVVSLVRRLVVFRQQSLNGVHDFAPSLVRAQLGSRELLPIENWSAHVVRVRIVRPAKAYAGLLGCDVVYWNPAAILLLLMNQFRSKQLDWRSKVGVNHRHVSCDVIVKELRRHGNADVTIIPHLSIMSIRPFLSFWPALAGAVLLTACATIPTAKAVCPTIRAYQPADVAALTAELKTLDKHGAVAQAIVEYRRLRDELRTCQAIP